MSKISVVIPVYNEEKQLESSVKNVLEICKKNYRNFEIIIADNASTDKTRGISKKLSDSYKEVRYIYLGQKGRGLALKKAWSTADTDIMCYMDVDLSTDLKHLKQLTDAIENGYDISFGSRLKKNSEVKRLLKRNILSKGYNILLKIFFDVKFDDAQCGFKAINRKVKKKLMPEIKDNEWFFDTELLIKGEMQGYKLKEIPVRWIEDKESKVKIVRTVKNYIWNILRLKKEVD